MAFVRQSSSMNMESIRCRSCQLQKLPYAAGPSPTPCRLQAGKGELKALILSHHCTNLWSRVSCSRPRRPPHMVWGVTPPHPPAPRGSDTYTDTDTDTYIYTHIIYIFAHTHTAYIHTHPCVYIYIYTTYIYAYCIYI